MPAEHAWRTLLCCHVHCCWSHAPTGHGGVCATACMLKPMGPSPISRPERDDAESGYAVRKPSKEILTALYIYTHEYYIVYTSK